MTMAEDLDSFFDDDEFAVEALWKGATTVKVIFDNAYLEAFELAGSDPHFVVAEGLMPGAAEGDAIVINGTSFQIAQPPQPDGTGLMRVDLEHVS